MLTPEEVLKEFFYIPGFKVSLVNTGTAKALYTALSQSIEAGKKMQGEITDWKQHNEMTKKLISDIQQRAEKAEAQLQGLTILRVDGDPEGKDLPTSITIEYQGKAGVYALEVK